MHDHVDGLSSKLKADLQAKLRDHEAQWRSHAELLRQQFLAAAIQLGELRHHQLTCAVRHLPGTALPGRLDEVFKRRIPEEPEHGTLWRMPQLIELFAGSPRAGDAVEGEVRAVGDTWLDVLFLARGYYNGEAAAFQKFIAMAEEAGRWLLLAPSRCRQLLPASILFNDNSIDQHARQLKFKFRHPDGDWMQTLHHLAAMGRCNLGPVQRCTWDENTGIPIDIKPAEVSVGTDAKEYKPLDLPKGGRVKVEPHQPREWYLSRLEQNVFRASAIAIDLLLKYDAPPAPIRSKPELNDTDSEVAAYIRDHPGTQATAIGNACLCSAEHVRRIVSRKLKSLGYTNRPGSGYYPPDAV